MSDSVSADQALSCCPSSRPKKSAAEKVAVKIQMGEKSIKRYQEDITMQKQWEIKIFALTRRVILNEQDRPISPTWGASQDKEFTSSCSLAEPAIRYIITHSHQSNDTTCSIQQKVHVLSNAFW